MGNLRQDTATQQQKVSSIAEQAQASFSRTHDAREQALRLSREVIRNSANSIRATHRGEFGLARELANTARDLTRQVRQVLADEPAVYYAGFVEDAEKEFAEACVTLALVEGSELPGPDDLQVGAATYMNGLAEAMGELRRYILDSLRRDDFARCEELLGVMDDVYTALVSMDFPDAVTRGLRRTTDMVRGVLERTRGDLTVALRQRSLERKLAEVQQSLAGGGPSVQDSAS